MMKKLVVLMLVLAVGSMASAGVILSGPGEAVEGTEFTLIVSGLASDAPGSGFAGGVYSALGYDGTAPTGWTVEMKAGNLGTADRFADADWDLNGIDFTAGQLAAAPGSDAEVKDGVWLTLKYIAGPAGTTETFNLFNYEVSYNDPVGFATVKYIVPEPMSMLLLGVGGLFLRRRK